MRAYATQDHRIIPSGAILIGTRCAGARLPLRLADGERLGYVIGREIVGALADGSSSVPTFRTAGEQKADLSAGPRGYPWQPAPQKGRPASAFATRYSTRPI